MDYVGHKIPKMYKWMLGIGNLSSMEHYWCMAHVLLEKYTQGY